MSILQQQHRKGRQTPLQTHTSPYQLYLNSLALSGRSAMATLLNHCTLLLGHDGVADTFPWQDLNFDQVHQVRAILVEMGYSVNTINMTIAGLRGVTKASFNLGLINADNMLRVNAIKPIHGSKTSRKGRSLKRIEINALKSACRSLPSKSQQTRALAIVLSGIGAGLRCAELCALNIEDVDTQESVLLVREGKGRKQRRIYLSPDTFQAIKRWVDRRDQSTGALFTRVLRNDKITEERLTTSGLTYCLRKIRQTADIDAFSPHDLRRTFITQLLEKGVDLNIVRQLAGHSDISTTIRYDKRDEQWQKQASQSLRF